MAVRSLIDLYEAPLKSAVDVIRQILNKAVEEANKKLLGKVGIAFFNCNYCHFSSPPDGAT